MKWTATILFALAATLARADYPAGTTDSDLLRSGTPVVTNAWLAVSNETARLVENHVPEVDASRITDGTNTIDAARNFYATSHNWQFTGQRDDDYISLTYGSDAWTMVVYSDSLGTDTSSIVTNENVTRLVFNFPEGDRAYSITAFRNVPTYVGRLALTNDIPTITEPDFTTNNTQLVHTIEATAPAPPSASDATPLIDGTASAGTTNAWARGDHVHPSDTSKLDGAAVYSVWKANHAYVGRAVVSYKGRLWLTQFGKVPLLGEVTPPPDKDTNDWVEVCLKDIMQETLPYPTNAIPFAAITGSPSLAGQTFDFSRNYDIIRATAAIAEALGATVTNNPTAQGGN